MRNLLITCIIAISSIFGDQTPFKIYGTTYGGFYYPENLEYLDSKSVVYCFGAGEDISHDIIIAGVLNSKVHIFDPTPRAIDHVMLVKGVFSGSKEIFHSPAFGGGDKNYWNILMENRVDSSMICFYPEALYISDCFKKFFFPLNEKFVSCSILKNGRRQKEWKTVQCKKLSTIMNELGHSKIDLLKIDIEGVECDVIDQMLDEGIFPTYLSVDFDLGWNMPPYDKDRCYQVISRLKSLGYTVIHSCGSDWSFFYTKRRSD